MPSESLPRARTQELSGLERELRQINAQIETLIRPCGIDNVVGKAVDTLRDDLAEIGLMLQEAMPRKAVEALEGEVRKLTDRIDYSRHANGDSAAVAGVERGLAEVRDALRALTPAESLVGFDRTVLELSRKVDLIGGNSPDPAALEQLEGAIVAMRGIVSHVASNDALAKLSEEVRAIADKVDQATSGGGSDLLSSLERRIASLADALEARNRNGHDAPRELETVVRGLIDRIERVPLGQVDPAAFGHLEERIAKLVEKLDVSDARISQLEAIERGLAELLIHLENQRVPQPAQGAAALPEVDALHRDVADLRQAERKTQDSLEAVHGTLGHVVDRLAMIETGMREQAAQPLAAAAAASPTLRAPGDGGSGASSDRSQSAAGPPARAGRGARALPGYAGRPHCRLASGAWSGQAAGHSRPGRKIEFHRRRTSCRPGGGRRAAGAQHRPRA
jgi:localization factor PodJL